MPACLRSMFPKVGYIWHEAVWPMRRIRHNKLAVPDHLQHVVLELAIDVRGLERPAAQQIAAWPA